MKAVEFSPSSESLAPSAKKRERPAGRSSWEEEEDPATSERPPDRGGLLNDFAVQREVEAVTLDFVGYAQADRHVDDFQDDQRDDRIVDDDHADADQLIDDLLGVAFDEAGRTAIFIDRQDPGQNRADGAADAVDAEAVERVVIAEGVLE